MSRKSHPDDLLALAAQAEEIASILTPAEIVNHYLQTAAPLPLGLKPQGFLKRKVSHPVDLGDFNEEYRGICLVFNLRIPMGIQELLARMQDSTTSAAERGDAAMEWLHLVIAGWNLAVEQPDGSIRAVPQPQEGGLQEFPLDADLLKAVAEAFNSTFSPSQD